MASYGDASCAKGPHTLYSQQAVSLDSGLVRIKSPDGMKVLVVKREDEAKNSDGVDMLFTVDAYQKMFSLRLPGFNGEVLWSPDSSAFAVTETEGGGGIGNVAYLFYVSETGVKMEDVHSVVERAFGTPAKCEVAVGPNTAIVGWLHGSKKILVAAEVVPVSLCECMGMYKVYELSVPDMRIVKTYSQITAKKRFWDLLGCELRDADSACAERLQGN